MAKEKKVDVPVDENLPQETAAMSDEGATEQPAEAPTSEQMLRNHLKMKDGEDVHSAALSHIQDLQGYKKQNEKVNKKLVDAFENSPEFAQMTKEVLAGVPVHIAIARNIDVESMTPQQGDDDFEDYQNAVTEQKKSKAEKEKYLKDMDDNIKLSAKQVDEFAKENKLSDDEAENFLKDVDQLVSDMVAGKVTKEALGTFYKGLKRDDDVADAKEAGKVEGKNAKIDALKEKQDAAKGDGLPTLEAQNVIKEPAKPELDNWSKAIIEKNQRTKR